MIRKKEGNGCGLHRRKKKDHLEDENRPLSPVTCTGGYQGQERH